MHPDLKMPAAHHGFVILGDSFILSQKWGFNGATVICIANKVPEKVSSQLQCVIYNH